MRNTCSASQTAERPRATERATAGEMANRRVWHRRRRRHRYRPALRCAALGWGEEASARAGGAGKVGRGLDGRSVGEGGREEGRKVVCSLCLPSRRGGRVSAVGASRWGPLHPRPRVSRFCDGQGRGRGRERVGDDIDTLPRSEASGRARSRHQPRRRQAPTPNLPCAILAGTERARARPRRLSWDFFSTTLDRSLIAGHSKSVSQLGSRRRGGGEGCLRG